MGDSLYYLLASFLRKEKIHFNQDELKLQLLSHPSYPSLHSVTGVLDHFGIENMALEVPKNRETVFQLPTNFISLISDKKEFVIVTQHEKIIELVFSDKKKKSIPLDDFLDQWSGIIVVIEKGTIEIANKKTLNTSLLHTIYFLSAIVLSGVFFFRKPSLFHSTHFIISLIGIGISFLIIKHELGFQSKALDKICTANKTTNCDAVLNSKGASISKHFKLSDLSFIYFSGLTLFWLISINFSASANAIVLLTLIALPITIYSIYYQYNVVKKWCPLCLGIVSVLWLQCCTLFFDQTLVSSIRPDIKSSFILFFSFLIVTTLWLFIKPLLQKQQELEKLTITHYKFKRNFDLFNAAYNMDKTIDTSIDVFGIDKSEIVLGNKKALLNILLITSPSCFFCKAAHNDLEKILKKQANDVSLTIRFNVPADKSNIANKVASRLLEIYNSESENECMNALHEAYEKDVDFNEWLLKWKESKENSFENVLEATKEWCIDNNFNFTPAIFINGKEFPKAYDRSDLSYFIEDLIELEESDRNRISKIESELV